MDQIAFTGLYMRIKIFIRVKVKKTATKNVLLAKADDMFQIRQN